MNMEIEFDDRALKNMGWGYRLTDYLDVYENNRVFDSLKVAYYQEEMLFINYLNQKKKQTGHYIAGSLTS